MNSSFGIWLIGAGAAVLVILLLLGAPVAERELEPALELAELDNAGDAEVASSYWQPVVEEPAPASVVYTPAPTVVTTSTVVPCPGCGSTYAAPATPTPTLVGGCGYPSTPCGRPACNTCRGRMTPAAKTVSPPEPSTVPLVGGCGRPSVPCGMPACAPLVRGCYDVCADPCHLAKPGINRNMPLCVDECSFIQLHSTVSHPICGQVRFEWSASKGWFLDPTASDPLYFAPTTQFCNGEDVWITLIVTDASGAQYSDVVSVRIRDLP
jgi:hypothetical protein